MEEQIYHYIGLLVLILIGIFVIKKFASCLIRIIVTLIILAAAAYIYYLHNS